MAKVLPRLTPEVLIPRLGDYLLKRGMINEEQLQKALAYQQSQVKAGNQFLLGQALVELGLLDRAALDQAVTEQIIQLRTALQATNRTLEGRVRDRTEELQDAMDRLSEMAKVKENFVANISHELRTPLTHIVGYLDLLASGELGQLSEKQLDAVHISQRSTSRLEGLIEDLIMFSAATRGELKLVQEEVEIYPFLETIALSAKQKADNRGVQLEFLPAEGLPHVQMDPKKLGWALGHLVDNAIKFTPDGGSVRISAGEEASQLVMITISDTGIGIPAARLAEIFEPFHQLDGSSKRRYNGTGLGLSMVRQIVEAHGSMIDVRSEEGKGTQVKFPLMAVRPLVEPKHDGH
jgi:signal transduction histidine kinase